ncbi:MAG: hypothetical protein EBR87_05830 [Cytophagia bacterium]|nr:hypothetical protein [Cytophagia bacterium]
MRYVKNLLFLFIVFSSQIAKAQLIRLEGGIGATQISWLENQPTTDLNVQLSIQKKQSKRKFFVSLKAAGNLQRSNVSNANATKINANDELYSNYRGSEAEVGFMWNQKTSILPIFYPILSLYSKSIARKISTNSSHYIEEEKYSLHGINAGIGVIIPGKTAITFQGQIFEPILRDITLYGNYVGVPYSSTSTANDLCYKGKIGFKKAKIGALLSYEILNLGAAENKNSKSILASQVNSLSISFLYEF